MFSFSTFPNPFSKWEFFCLIWEKDFPIMSNFYLAEILNEPTSLTIETSKKILKMSSYMLILSIFFSHNENQEFVVYILLKNHKVCIYHSGWYELLFVKITARVLDFWGDSHCFVRFYTALDKFLFWYFGSSIDSPL